MKVSVVIPVYNAEKYILRSVRSALDQPEVVEVLLVNDGSVDSSLDLCKELERGDDRVVVLCHSNNKNKGVAASRNLGIMKAKSDFVAFLDADDYYLTNRFSTARLIFESDTTVDGVYETVCIKSNEGPNALTLIERVNYDELFENLQPLGKKVWFHINGLTVKKSIFNKCGTFNENLRTTDDTHMWFQMASTSKLIPGSINNPVAVYEKNSESLTSDSVLVNKDQRHLLLCLYNWAVFRKLYEGRKELILNRLFFYLYADTSLGLLKHVKYFKIILYLLKIDFKFLLFRSKAFRRYLGNFIGYNYLKKQTSEYLALFR